MNCPLNGKPCDKQKFFHITNVENQKTISFDVCEDCLGQVTNQPKPKTEAPSAVMLQTMMELLGFAMGAAIGSALKPQMGASLPKTPDPLDQVCVGCGITLREISTTGRLGCPACYNSFNQSLMPILEKNQFDTKHVGKVPESFKKQNIDLNPVKYIVDQKRRMKECIAQEKYEEAGAIRDRLMALEALRDRLEQSVKDDDEDQAEVLRNEIARFVELARKAELNH